MSMKKEFEEDSRKEGEDEAAPSPDDDESPNHGGGGTKGKKKKSKKSKSKEHSRRRVDDVDDDVGAVDNESGERGPEGERRARRLAQKSEKRQRRSQLLSQVPTHDADGVPYNKIQIRRMMRRVKHGLDPVATEEEEREIREREKSEREEEVELYAGQRDDGENAVLDEVNVNEKDDNQGSVRDENNQYEENVDDGKAAEKTFESPPPTKKSRRAKPVPPDYVCQACQNRLPDVAPHWIYDCPMKKTRRGCNRVSKRFRGLHDPPSRKVFVSGLPFDCSEGDVKQFFEGSVGGDENGNAELVHCKLLKFEDSNRCKGQAFLTFDSDDGAKMALKLNGSIWKYVEQPGKKGKKKKDKTSHPGKKELKVNVSRVLNRHVTKQKRSKSWAKE